VTPLAWYRRTGADPPFGDQRRAHGTRFEGYYWRLTDAAAGRVAIVLCGVCRDAAGPWAIVALAAEPGGLVRSRIEPLAEVSFSDLGVRAGSSLAGSFDALRVDLGADARLELRFEDRVEWPRRAFGGTGPAQILPGLPQYWHPHLLGGRVTGSGWDGATVYAEKNWGPRFTEHWWWGQAQAFEGTDACVAFAGGRVLGGAPTGVVVRVEDRVLRLAPPFAALRTSIGDASWRVHARSPRWRSRSKEKPPASRPSCRSRCPASAGSPTAPSSTSPAASARPSSGPGACGGRANPASQASSAGSRPARPGAPRR